MYLWRLCTNEYLKKIVHYNLVTTTISDIKITDFFVLHFVQHDTYYFRCIHHTVNNTVFLLKWRRISCKICAYFSHYTYCTNLIMAVCYSDHIQCVLTQNSEFSSSGPQSGFSGLTLVQWVIGQVRWRDLQIILPDIQDTQNTVPWPCWNTHTTTL